MARSEHGPPTKKATGQSRNETSEGFGFYAHPKGTIYGITMIVDFSDQSAKFTKEQVSDWLNKPGFSMGITKGSVRDYCHDCSNGKVTLNNDVVGYYRAKKPKSYYEGSTGYSKATELVNELISYFDPSVDFSKYDNDGNGTTESISIVYAGSGQIWGQGLWPHSRFLVLRRSIRAVFFVKDHFLNLLYIPVLLDSGNILSMPYGRNIGGLIRL